jgi:Asp-tRNA(Asn)/Glu-tRNA(Gln) amidotransferase C subunit
MDNNISKLSDLSKIHFTLDELEEMNRDMESIMQLMDSIKDVDLPPESDNPTGSNIYQLRPDTSAPCLNPPSGETPYFKIPRIIE